MLQLSSPLVSTDWLEQHLQAPELKIVDASWHMPTAKRDAMAEYAAGHIPHAVFFDLDATSDHSSPLPHMLPDADTFARAMCNLGICNHNIVVVYDCAGLFSAARLWWMLRVFGHRQVAVLDGGLPKWQTENKPLHSGAMISVPKGDFLASFCPDYVRNKSDVLQNIHAPDACVMDARSAERFSGAVAEPRAGLRLGHIPNSVNLPFSQLLQTDGTLKNPDDLRILLAATQGKPVISSCGSGVTACIIDLALEYTGHRNHAVYDGSWAEWGADANCPLATTTQKVHSA